jgi:hypothetical protein
MEMTFLNKIAEQSLLLAVVIGFSIFAFRYLISVIKSKDEIIKSKDEQIERIINESNKRYDSLEERHVSETKEYLSISQEKDKFLADTILRVTDSIATLTYTNAKVFKSYKNSMSENEKDIKAEG